MNKTIQLLGLLTLFFLLSTLVQAQILTVEVNGQTININDEFCQQEDEGIELLGSDFYLYCETNFEEAYNDESLLLNHSTEPLPVEETGWRFNDEQTRKLLKVLSAALLLLVIIMIIIRHRSTRLHKLDSFLRLQPYLAQLKNRGYSEQEIHDLLLKRGYDENFINDFLKRK